MIKKVQLSLYPFITILLYLFSIIRLSYVKNINSYSLVVNIFIFLYLVLK